jgi:hypothetical protein
MLSLGRYIGAPLVVAPALLTALSVATHHAEAKPLSSYEATLKACRTSAVAASNSVPTEFKCDWKKLQKGAPNGALNGRFDTAQKGIDGSMVILDGGSERTLVAIQTVHQSSTHTCTVRFSATRDASGALAAKPADVPNCIIRIERYGLTAVHVIVNGCETYCGMRASFAGRYELLAK